MYLLSAVEEWKKVPELRQTNPMPHSSSHVSDLPPRMTNIMPGPILHEKSLAPVLTFFRDPTEYFSTLREKPNQLQSVIRHGDYATSGANSGVRIEVTGSRFFGPPSTQAYQSGFCLSSRGWIPRVRIN